MDQLVCFVRENEALIGFVGTMIGLIGVVGTIVALAMAIWQTKDLKSITEALPTKDIGAFPTYVTELTKLLESAKNRILIVCDAPCYCIISDYQLWTNYEAAIKKAYANFLKAKKPSISILWMDSECRKSVLQEQFCPDQPDQPGWKEGLEEKLQIFLTAVSDQDVRNLKYYEFEKLVEQAHCLMAASVNKVVGPPLHDTLPLYFWIIDDEAIFAIPNYKDRGEGRAFHTRDMSIVKGLEFISDRLRDNKRVHQQS
jgi:hypothetical protein